MALVTDGDLLEETDTLDLPAAIRAEKCTRFFRRYFGLDSQDMGPEALAPRGCLLIETTDPGYQTAQHGGRCDNASAAPLPMDQAQVGETRESLSDDTAGHAEPLLQFLFSGKCVPRHEDLVLDLLVQDVADLRVERADVAAVDPRLQFLC